MPTFGSRLFGSSPFAGTGGAVPAPPPSDLPADLAAAVAARSASDTTLATLASGGVFDTQASGTADPPHVVFKVGGGSPAFDSDTSRWLDQKIRFECSASHASAANALARAVAAAFSDVALSHADGVTSPLVLVGRSEAVERQRGKGNARVFRSSVEYSARSRLGRPS